MDLPSSTKLVERTIHWALLAVIDEAIDNCSSVCVMSACSPHRFDPLANNLGGIVMFKGSCFAASTRSSSDRNYPVHWFGCTGSWLCRVKFHLVLLVWDNRVWCVGTLDTMVVPLLLENADLALDLGLIHRESQKRVHRCLLKKAWSPFGPRSPGPQL